MTLTVQNLTLSFDKPIFANVNFSLAQGQIACLLGKSGCGKTSILRCLLGFETPQMGHIALDGRVLFDDKVPKGSIPPHLRGIGMVFQDYALFPHLSVAKNIGFGIKHLDEKSRTNRIEELLELTKLSAFANRYPHELSGGQQQRVALARALAPKPSLILLDEPFSNLDVSLRQELSLQIRDLLKKSGVSAILVTHDQSEAFAFADTIGIIANGALEQWADPQTLYQQPASQAVAAFIGNGTLLDIQKLGDGMVTTALGDIPYQNTIAPNPANKALIRPQHICLSNANNGTAAKVCGKQFLGAAWQYSVQLSDETLLTLQIPDDTHQLGDTLYLSAKSAWIVQ